MCKKINSFSWRGRERHALLVHLSRHTRSIRPGSYFKIQLKNSPSIGIPHPSISRYLPQPLISFHYLMQLPANNGATRPIHLFMQQLTNRKLIIGVWSTASVHGRRSILAIRAESFHWWARGRDQRGLNALFTGPPSELWAWYLRRDDSA